MDPVLCHWQNLAPPHPHPTIRFTCMNVLCNPCRTEEDVFTFEINLKCYMNIETYKGRDIYLCAVCGKTHLHKIWHARLFEKNQ
jgi:hypothetical protein